MGKIRQMSSDPVFASKLRGYKPARAEYWDNWNACAECDYIFRNSSVLGECPHCGSYDTYKPFAATVNWKEIDARRQSYADERVARLCGGGVAHARDLHRWQDVFPPQPGVEPLAEATAEAAEKPVEGDNVISLAAHRQNRATAS